MQSVKIRENIYWVGVQDPDLRVFDIIMRTEKGSSYNAYLIKGSEKTALIETVKDEFFEEYIEKLQEIIKLEDIDYLIMNHTEPDHSGSIARLLEKVPGITVVGSSNTIEFLREIINKDFDARIVGQGSKLNLGDKSLHFIGAILLHWPDSIYSYLPEERILFTCDSFGSHYSSVKIFDDLIEEDFSQEYKYYFDVIMGPFKPYVLRALERIKELDIDIICPGHGPILRSNITHYINLYRQWATPVAESDPRPKIVMAYASAYGYTRMLADSIIEGLNKSGDFNLKEFDLVEASTEEILLELENARGFLIGSPTINKDCVPPVWNLLSSMSPIIHEAMVAAAFGAYGWSGEAVPNMQKRLHMLRMNVLPGLRIRFQPSRAELEQAMDFGSNFGRAVLAGNQDLLEFQFINDSEKREEVVGNYIKEYANKDIVVYWDPALCQHDTHCFTRLPQVFNPEARPWVKIDGAPAEAIIRSINRCPSGALRYSLPAGSAVNPELAKGAGLLPGRK